nr:hypothetical protein [Tanacetum cinerariifolium]
RAPARAAARRAVAGWRALGIEPGVARAPATAAVSAGAGQPGRARLLAGRWAGRYPPAAATRARPLLAGALCWHPAAPPQCPALPPPPPHRPGQLAAARPARRLPLERRGCRPPATGVLRASGQPRAV